MLDGSDQHGIDTHFPPRFDCENHYGKMIIIFYNGVKGRIYKYEE